MTETVQNDLQEASRLQQRLERERQTRLQVEAIAEKTIREQYDRQQQLLLLEKIARTSNQSAAIDETLKFAIAQVCEFTEWEIGHCYLIEGKGEEQRLYSSRLWYAKYPSKIAEFRELSEQTKFPSGIGLPGRVLESGEPAWIVDVTTDTNFPRSPVARKCGLKGAAAFPMRSGDEIVGVMEFFTSNARAPDKKQLDIMAHVGMQLGRVIERQRAEEQMKAQAQELMRARDEALAADRAKSIFLSNMSHELRTPLNAILGFSQMIRDEMVGALDPKYRDYARDIFDSGQHLKSILNDILDMSKVDAGRMELREEAVCVSEVVAACRRIISPTAEANGLTLSFELQEPLPLVRSDGVRLKQILLNLMSNAVKFTPRAGKVIVGVWTETGGLVIVVKDSGIGMNSAEIALALQPFRQIEHTLSRRFDGTGLGLPLAKALVELHGGTLRIDSTPGEGTCVRIDLPPERTIQTACRLSRAAS